ncbi:MAG: excinuclease ABC subunit C, partial [Candidatus Omnitrophica bacterium]|nr:excinuclease ABC subunit C [Candidatus Omnitrophota bacterium]
ELDKLGLSKIPVVGIAKEFERIYCKDKSEPVILPEDSKSLHLLKRMRDEAHRFAINFHRSLRSKRLRRDQ